EPPPQRPELLHSRRCPSRTYRACPGPSPSHSGRPSLRASGTIPHQPHSRWPTDPRRHQSPRKHRAVTNSLKYTGHGVVSTIMGRLGEGALPLSQLPGVKDAGEEIPRPLLTWVADDFLGGSGLDNDPAVHEHHAVGDLPGEFHLVGDHD